jgi:hypothetical protein
METRSSQTEAALPAPLRKPWEAPAIVFERALIAHAQDGPPPPPGTDPRSPFPGFLGPLSASAGGTC